MAFSLGLFSIACSENTAGPIATGGSTSAKGGTPSSGGTTSSGGTPSQGGTTATGGTTSSGGTTAKGGTTVGGSSGAPSGGTTDGGAAKGGTTLPDAATKGDSASGGISMGGTAAGGIPVGGTSVGGSSAGGSGGTSPTGGSISTGPCPIELIGWATEGSGTTGGGNATPKVVTSAAELKTLAGGTDPQVIHLQGSFSGGLAVGSNKTIIGLGKTTTINGGIAISGSNIIIRNLIGKGGTDTLAARGSHHIWLDHLDMSDGADGVIDLTRSSDFATVSWSKIYYKRTGAHRLALLFGGGSTHTEDRGKNNHTVHHNWFGEGVDQRMPRLLFGKGHIYNNFYNSPGNTYCIGSGSWASLLVEGNYFKNVTDPHRFQDGNPSFITAKDNVYDNVVGKKDTGLGGSGSSPPGAWTPSYAYTLDKAEGIPELVQRCAGPQ